MKICGFSYEELFKLAINKPILAQLEITQNCNQECSFCFKRCSYKKKYKDLSVASWKKIIRQLADFGVENLNFTGGEVFLYKNFLNLVDYSKSKRFKKVVVNTNGTVSLVDKNLSNIDSLIFSVHGLKEQHDLIVGRKGSFERLVKNLKIAKKNKINVAINMVVTPQNINILDDILGYFKKLNLQFYAFNLAGDINGETKVSEVFFKKYLLFLKRAKRTVGDNILLRHGMQNITINNKDFFEAKIPLPHCAAGKYKLLINYKGDVFPCSFFQTDDFYCGNILRDDLSKIWSAGKGFVFFRKQYLKSDNLPSKCKTCYKKYKCSGGCFVWRNLNNNTKKYEKDIRCDFGHAYSRD